MEVVMTLATPKLPKAGQLRWEIGFALLIKILLLIGLWLLIFRWMDKPTAKPDIAEHLFKTTILIPKTTQSIH
jgi:hypothetical protein